MSNETIHTSTEPYAPLADFPGEVEGRVLRRDPERGASTFLVRIPPAGRVDAHSHLGVVQHYIVEGEYEQDGKSFASGTYRMFPAHADIPEIRSRDGAKVLMIYDPTS